MFGPKKSKKEEVKPATIAAALETPDLVIPNPNQESPQTVGMPGFTADPEPAKAPVQSPDSQAINAEAIKTPASAPKKQYQIVAAEIMPDGLYRYVIVTNKNLGEVGGVYEA